MTDYGHEGAGRAPGDVCRSLNITGGFGQKSAGFLQGPVAQWVEQLAELAVTDGILTFIRSADQPDLIERFGAEVAPAVQELVAGQRFSRSSGPKNSLAQRCGR